MRQLILRGAVDKTGAFALEPDQSKYLVKVLRMKEGDVVKVRDSSGRAFVCTIREADPRRLKLTCEGEAENAPGAATEAPAAERTDALPKIALVQALPKGPKLDLIVRQAVEMGVELIVPLTTKRCIQKEDEEISGTSKQRRRSAIIAEARQQSGSGVATRMCKVHKAPELPETLGAEGFGAEDSHWILFHETKMAGSSLHGLLEKPKKSVVVLIGPEGGLDDEETAEFESMGFEAFHLEGPILRTETAALAAISAIKIILTERKAWKISP